MHWTLLLRTGNLVCSPVWPHCLRGFNFSSHSEVNYRVTRRVVKKLEREKLDSAPLSALFVKTERKWWSTEWKIWSGQNPHNGGKERSRLAGNRSQKEKGPMMSWKNFEREKTCMSCCVKHYFPPFCNYTHNDWASRSLNLVMCCILNHSVICSQLLGLESEC